MNVNLDIRCDNEIINLNNVKRITLDGGHIDLMFQDTSGNLSSRSLYPMNVNETFERLSRLVNPIDIESDDFDKEMRKVKLSNYEKS